MKRIPTVKTISFLVLTLILVFAVFCMPVSADTEDGSTDTQLPDNGIPVVYINIDESQVTIEQMYDSPDHSVYCYGTISIIVPKDFHYSDFEETALKSLEGLSISMRGRGNSTWSAYTDKKPFKIKLEDKKADVLGLGENKHWVLLANHFDSSFIKNRITAWLGDKMGFEFTPRGVPVDLVLSGEIFGTKYMGNYYLSENVRVDKNRLNIDELDEDDTDPLTITGGYLLQNGYQVDKDSPDRFFTKRNADWATHTPSFDTGAESLLSSEADNENSEDTFGNRELADAYKNNDQQQYIQNYIQHFEDVLYEEGTAYRDLMDLESAAKYWLIQTFTLNGDAYATGSTYMYKVRDSEDTVGKIYWGPLWDFDFGWDRQTRTTGIPYGHEWMKPMLYDTEPGGFVEEIHKQWPKMKEYLQQLIAEGGIIDGYYEETKVSAKRDHERYYPGDENDYRQTVEHLREWIRKRLEWFDENLGMIDTMIHKVTYIVDGEVYLIDFKANTEYIDGSEPHPEKDGYVYIGWTDEEGNVIKGETPITEDRIITAKYVSDEEATHVADIAFRKDNDLFKLNVHISMYQIDFELIPADTDDQYVEWSSSDENYATVDEYGVIKYNGPGTVTITAKLKYGTTRQFTLTVIDEELPVPEAIKPVEEEIKMSVDEQTPIYITTEPTPTKINEYYYESEDETVVTVDEYGVLTAVGEGQTTVKITTVSYGPEEDITLVTYVTVTVKNEPITYSVTDGEGSSWQKGSSENITYTVKRSVKDETCFSHFTGVSIDDEDLEMDKDYTAAIGSTVVTINSSVLETLGEGEHTVKLSFDDGEVTTVLTVKANPDSPETGVGSILIIYAGILCLSVLGVTAVLNKKKKYQ